MRRANNYHVRSPPVDPLRQDVGLLILIRHLHGQQYSDSEIAAAWNHEHPSRPIDRRTVSEIRGKMGLPSHGPYSARYRRRVADKTREQCVQAGVRSLAEVRAKAYRAFARRRGWPEHLRPREVQILDLLYEQGPKTREEIAVAIGWRIERGQRAYLACKYGRGNYVANLMAAGLVARSARRINFGRGQGRSVYTYFIPPHVRRGGFSNGRDQRES